MDRVIVGMAGALTIVWVAVAAFIAASKCSAGILACGSINELGDFVGGMTAPVAFLWLFCTVWFQAAQLREQRAELKTMSEHQSAIEAKAAFDEAVSTLANRLIVNDAAWLLEWKGNRISFTKDDYETADSALTVMKAEAALQSQLKAYALGFEDGHRISFLQKAPDAFLEIRSALLRASALAQGLPPEYAHIADGMNLGRFVENVEGITRGSYEFSNDPKYSELNLPSDLRHPHNRNIWRPSPAS